VLLSLLGNWRCLRAATLYDGIHCPAGHYKEKRSKFEDQCEKAGLPCPQGKECYCRPCIKAFEVDVMQLGYDSSNASSSNDDDAVGSDDAAGHSEVLTVDMIGSAYNDDDDIKGCDKMALCGKFRQRQTANFAIHDNRERIDPDINVVMHAGQKTFELPVQKSENVSFLYEFTYTTNAVGISIMEVFFDDIQIPESPFRVETLPAECSDSLKEAVRTSNVLLIVVCSSLCVVPSLTPTMHQFHHSLIPSPIETLTSYQDAHGICVCAAGTVEIGSQCFDAGIFAAIVVSIVAVIIVIITYFYLQHRRAKSDEVWQVKVEELHFGQKAEIIGQGSFGVVLLAEYRGTKVAIKRVLPVAHAGSGSTRQGSISKTKTTTGSITGSLTGSLTRKSRRNSVESAESKESKDSTDKNEEGSDDQPPSTVADDHDEESQQRSSFDGDVMRSSQAGGSADDEFAFLGHVSYGRHKSRWEKLLPKWLYNGDGDAAYNASILGTASASTYSRTISQQLCPWFTEDYRRKQEFITEMRLLSRLRHPCKLNMPCRDVKYRPQCTSKRFWGFGLTCVYHFSSSLSLTSCIFFDLQLNRLFVSHNRYYDCYGSNCRTWPSRTDDGHGIHGER
jgi:hypothetical protein